MGDVIGRERADCLMNCVRPWIGTENTPSSRWMDESTGMADEVEAAAKRDMIL